MSIYIHVVLFKICFGKFQTFERYSEKVIIDESGWMHTHNTSNNTHVRGDIDLGKRLKLLSLRIDVEDFSTTTSDF